MKKLIEDCNGQAGGIVTLVFIISVFSFAYIILSVLMDQFVLQSNTLMATFHFTQEHRDAAVLVNMYWFALPVIVILSLIVFTIQNAIRTRTGEV